MQRKPPLHTGLLFASILRSVDTKMRCVTSGTDSHNIFRLLKTSFHQRHASKSELNVVERGKTQSLVYGSSTSVGFLTFLKSVSEDVPHYTNVFLWAITIRPQTLSRDANRFLKFRSHGSGILLLFSHRSVYKQTILLK